MENKSLAYEREHEKSFWDSYFSREIEKEIMSDKKFSSFWWEYYYNQMSIFVKKELSKYSSPKILEAGSGSGKASIVLGNKIDRTFLDISPKALDYAKILAKKFEANNIHYKLGDIFSIPFNNNSFDFVWNIGVIEHYSQENIKKAIGEMLRVTKSGGKVALGIPNFYSGPSIKSRIISHPLLNFIPGYKADSEKNYTSREIVSILNDAAKKENISLKNIKLGYVGNNLPVEAPRWLVLSFGKALEKIIPRTKFLILIIAEKE